MLENIKFERISTENSRVNGGCVNQLMQDTKGFIWIGTDHALARYDGSKFKIYQHDKNDPTSIPNDFIKDMYENKSGNLLIIMGLIGTALVEFNIKTERFEIIKTPFLNKNTEAFAITEDNSGFIWIGTFKEGLFKYDRCKNEFQHFICKDPGIDNSINCNTITSLYFDHDSENLYIGTKTGGINVYNSVNQRFKYLFNENDSGDLKMNETVKHIFKDSRKNIWFCTTQGLFMYNEENNVTKKFLNDQMSGNSISHNLVNTICEDKNGLLWIGTEKGLNCYDTEKNVFTRFLHDKNNPESIFYNIITTLTCDRTNTVFFGTHGGGIGKFDLNLSKFHNLKIRSSDPNNINSNHIRSIYKDKQNNLWVGTYRGWFYKCTPNEKNEFKITEFNELDEVVITGITGDMNNNVWISSNKKSLSYINCDNNKLKFIDPNLFSDHMQLPYRYIYCQCKDGINPNYLWLSVNWEALILFDTLNMKIVENDFAARTFLNLPIKFLYIDSNKVLWIATEGNGLYRCDIINNKVTNYNCEESNDNSLSDSNINIIVEDFENNFWIGTKSGGLNRLNKELNKIERFSIKVGLAGNRINGILADENGNLWIASSDVLTKFNITTKDVINFTQCGIIALDGCNLYACHKSYDGMMFFGTVNGVVYFKPDEIKTNEYIPNIVITDFQIFYESVKPSPENPFLKKSISYAEEITLTYKESVITLEFAALIFNNPKKNEYAYKMEGFDEDWVYCGTRRTATYTNLDPGEYTFRVKGSNNDGLWNEEGTSIEVIITPPWYKTILFKGLVGLSVIGSFGSFYRKRIQKLNKEKTQQEEFTKKLIESQENERKRVAAELHDSLGQDLLIIKNKALVSIKKTNDLEKFKKEMNEISDLTSATLNDVREISYNLRPYELDRLGLTKTIESMIERANNSTNINFVANIDNIDNVFIPEVEINIYRIIQESLNNVIKHSEAKEVIVSVLKKEKEIRVNISDDGKGFDMKKYKLNSNRKGFGLKGIEERVRLLNGEFNIESEVGKSTIIIIIIPLSK